MRRLSWALILALLLTACSSGQPKPTEPKQPEPIPAPAPTPNPTTPESPAPAPSHELMPKEGVETYYLTDGYDGQGRPVEEEWVREGNRLLATQGGGRPYVTWLLEPDGVWRPDPQNPKVLLRYLPAEPQDGLTWRQPSGNTYVYFRLRRVEIPSDGWVLTVLNRGERADWRFDNGHRVAVEAKDRPAEAFYKAGGASHAPLAVPAERRAAIIAAAPAVTSERAPIESVSQNAFRSVLRVHGYDDQAVDFDGDGQTELMQGAFGRRTWFGPELIGADGKVIAESQYGRSAATYTLATLGGRPRLLVLETTFGGSLEIRWFEQRDGKWRGAVAADLGPKMIGWTPATKAEVLTDGRLRIEWDPKNDPAGHRQIRHLRLTAEGGVEWLDETWLPRSAALNYPQTPQELLQAFFFTQWFDMQEEAKRYLARPEMAAQFPVDGQPTFFATEGDVEIGRVEAHCQVVKEELPASGPVPFWASIGWYEGGTIQGGTAQIGKASDGRLVIESIEIAPGCGNY